MRTRPGRLPATPPTIAPARLDVLVVDGHEPTRLGLGLLLKREPWVRRCVLAGDGGRAVAIARRLAPEVAVVDTTDLGPALAPLLAALRQAHPPVRFVLAARARTAVLAADLPGVAGVLPVEAGRDDVVRIVRAAGLEAAAATSAAAAFAAPATPPAPALGASTPARPSGPPPALRRAAADLTPREREILALLATGATNREIAARLHLGPDSIKKSASALYRKLGVRNRTEATRHADELLLNRA